ncbi:MAG TPA: hypothetical protein VNK43_01760 [Gemmatimonadales bacterium]|nr:hypothetical protein [Gemmatimonadales bacterium]
MTATTPESQLIDEFLPSYDVTERHEVDVRAPVERVFGAVRSLDLRGSLITRWLFLLRGLPALLDARGRRGRGLGLTLEGLLENGFILLGERPNRELLLGVVGKFWRPTGDIQRLDADGFRRFDTPGYAKAVWNFTVAPGAPAVSRLATETRVQCLDESSRRKFRQYWLLIEPFSGLIRKEAVEAIKRKSEEAPIPNP